MTKAFDPKRRHDREMIAHLAAKLMAEDAIDDFSKAKHKAARQLRVSDTHCLPSNMEIELALRQYHTIYQQEEQRDRVKMLRWQAVRIMKLLEIFEPRLTGSVLSGTATRHAAIDLMLVADSDKDVELFLLAKKLAYRRTERRLCVGDTCFKVPGFTLEDESVLVEIAVLAPAQWRMLPRSTADGKPWANLKQVECLLMQEKTENLINVQDGFPAVDNFVEMFDKNSTPQLRK